MDTSLHVSVSSRGVRILNPELKKKDTRGIVIDEVQTKAYFPKNIDVLPSIKEGFAY